jgi:hypothetical protein
MVCCNYQPRIHVLDISTQHTYPINDLLQAVVQLEDDGCDG